MPFAVVFWSDTPVSVAAAALRACAPGSSRASRLNNGLALQNPVRVMDHTIRLEALIWGRMFVFGLEDDNNYADDDDDEYSTKVR